MGIQYYDELHFQVGLSQLLGEETLSRACGSSLYVLETK